MRRRYQASARKRAHASVLGAYRRRARLRGGVLACLAYAQACKRLQEARARLYVATAQTTKAARVRCGSCQKVRVL